jgi:site-specific recombinase XerD
MASTAVAVHEQRKQDGWKIVTDLVLDGISSCHTRRAYSQALDEFLIWFRDETGRQFNKATVQKYRTELEAKRLAPSSINVRLSAIRRLALEAGDNGLLAPELAAGIARAKGAKRMGVRLGHWLTAEQAQSLLAAPSLTTLKGIRDSGLLALLLGGGLRRSELAALDVAHIQQRDGRWLIADLVGKHGRIRSVPIPLSAHAAVESWQTTAGISEGPLFRPVTRHRTVLARRISPQAVFDIVKFYARAIGVEIGPHDLRRSFAKLAHLGRAPLEQIQLSLGHASIVTTEIYLGVKQNLRDAPCDHLWLDSTAGSPANPTPGPERGSYQNVFSSREREHKNS